MVNYLEKAEKQFRAGKILFEKGYYNDSLSRLYYSLRSIAVFVVGRPEKGKWKHAALLKRFVIEIDTLGEEFKESVRVGKGKRECPPECVK